MYEEQEKAIIEIQDSLKALKNDERLAPRIIDAVNSILDDIDSLLAYTSAIEESFKIYDPGPGLIEPCSINPDCGENMGGGCHLMQGCE